MTGEPIVSDSDDNDRNLLDEVPLLRGEVAFRLLVEAVQDYAIFLLGPDGRVLTWNRGAERIKGYRAREIIGKHFSVFYTEAEREAGRPMSLLGWAAEYGRFEDEGWRVRKDGTRFWADVIVTALRDESGTPYAYAKITRDLTERREAEQQRLALLAEQQSRAAAEEALFARDRFLSIASHELKTPIATLQLATESLARSHAAGRLDDERISTGLRRMSRATKRLGVLVAELLDVARLTADAPSLRLAPTDMVDVTREVIGRFEDDEAVERISFDAPSAAWILGDAGRLDQVLTNLIDNALKYSRAPTPVEVVIDTERDGVCLTISDRGIGLDANGNGHIFEAFGRGANAEHVPGLGLGLFISEQIVGRHGGRITAEARSGGDGAVFTVWLPAHAPTADVEA
jgi:PAS domain S-box-containing protein